MDPKASTFNDENAARALVQLSRDDCNRQQAAESLVELNRFEQQFGEKALAAVGSANELDEAQPQTTEATWVLDRFGQRRFFNGLFSEWFSRDESREMRNDGLITENDVLAAFGYHNVKTAEAEAELSLLDPDRPAMTVDSFLTPTPVRKRSGEDQSYGWRSGEDSVEQDKPHKKKKSTIKTAADTASTTASHSSVSDPWEPLPASSSASTAEEFYPPTPSPLMDNQASPFTLSPLYPEISFTSTTVLPNAEEQFLPQQVSSSFSNSEPIGMLLKGDMYGVRSPLKPGPPQWTYLQTTVVRENGQTTQENYIRKDGSPITAGDFQDPEFCKCINRWYRQKHRRIGRNRIKAYSCWSSTESSILNGLIQHRGNKSWREITHEFNQTLNCQRSVISIKSFASKRLSRETSTPTLGVTTKPEHDCARDTISASDCSERD